MTLFDCPFNFFWPSILTIITALFKKDGSYRKAVVSNLQDANLKQSHERKKITCSHVSIVYVLVY